MSKPSFKIGLNKYEFNEISLKIYYKLQDLLANPEEGTEYKIVECLTGCPSETLLKLKYKDWLMVWEEAQLQITSLVGNTTAINPIITFQGVKYGLPNVDDMTVGEFADLDLILGDKNAERKLEDIAAIVYRPVIEQRGNVLKIEPYDTDGYKYRKEIFMDLPVSAVKSANSFFLQYANLSLKSTLDSLLATPEMKMLPEEDQATLQSLAQLDLGGNSSIDWLTKILYDLQKLRHYNSAPHLTGLPGKKTRLLKKLWPFKKKTQLEKDDNRN
jgi:hypothetical protein